MGMYSIEAALGCLRTIAWCSVKAMVNIVEVLQYSADCPEECKFKAVHVHVDVLLK